MSQLAFVDGNERLHLTTTPVTALKPTATTGPVSAKTATSATLTGVVNPNGAATTAYFEYGLDSSLTNPKKTDSQDVGSGTSSESISASISDLTPNTPYHYRIVATNAGGTTKSPTSSFTTEPSAPGTPDPGVTMQIEASVNFGTVPVGSGNPSRVIVISNDPNLSSGTLVGNVGSLSDPFTVVSGGGPFALQPGQVRIVAIEFGPSEEREYPVQHLFISHNAGNLPANPFPVVVRGTGGPRLKVGIEVSPNPIVIENADVGFTKRVELVVRNPASSLAALSGSVSGLVSPFSVRAATTFGLPPGVSTQIYIEFSPNRKGEFSGELIVTHNAGDPITIPVIGRTTVARLYVEPASINFGEKVVGESVPQKILLRSDAASTGPVTVTYKPWLSELGPFFLAPPPGFSTAIFLSPGQSVEWESIFSPSALGPVTGKFVFSRSDDPENLLTVQLTGIGVAPAPVRIARRVTDPAGNGISGVTITLSGTQSPAPKSTGSNGSFSFENLTPGGNYTVTPSKAGFAFSPPKLTFISLSGGQSANFTGSQPPAIATQPQSRTVIKGDRVDFSATGTGTDPLDYQWFLDGSAIPGATSQMLTVSDVQPSNAGIYTVLVDNSAGSVISSNAVLTVNVAPVIIQQPQSQTVAPGANVTFSVMASGAPAPTYRWQQSVDGGVNWSNLSNDSTYSGVTTATLMVSSTTPGMSGDQFRCVASNSAGSAISSRATLTDGTLDTDGDGHTDFLEDIAGTDPLNPASALRITAIREVGNNVELDFDSISGVTYRVESEDSLSDASWTVIDTFTTNITGTITIVDPGAVTQTNKFYRIKGGPNGEVVSDPAGYYGVTLNAGANAISVPLHNFGARRLVSSVSGSTVTVTGNPSWTANAFAPQNGFSQYIVLVRKDASASPGNEGDWWTVVGNTGNTLTLNPGTDDLSSLLSSGDQIEVRRLTSMKDLFGTGTTLILNKDSNGNAASGDSSQADVIRFISGTSFGQPIFYHDGTLLPAGYYVEGGNVGPLDGSTITVLPGQGFMVFRKAGSSPTTVLVNGQVQVSRLTQYLKVGPNVAGSPFAGPAPIGLSNLKESGWVSDSDGSAAAGDFSKASFLRLIAGTSFGPSVFHHDGSILSPAGWYDANGVLSNSFPLEPGKAYIFFMTTGNPVRWREAVP